jgi:hypothetical protein
MRAGQLVVTPRHVIAPDALAAYDPVEGAWLRLPPVPDGTRAGASIAWASGRLYLWGGTTEDSTVTDTGWVFNPELPPNTYRLPPGYAAGYGDCSAEAVQYPLVLRGDRDDPELAWFENRTEGRQGITWPDGYFARFEPDLTVIGPDGTVFGREGDRLSASGVGNQNLYSAVCFG